MATNKKFTGSGAFISAKIVPPKYDLEQNQTVPQRATVVLSFKAAEGKRASQYMHEADGHVLNVTLQEDERPPWEGIARITKADIIAPKDDNDCSRTRLTLFVPTESNGEDLARLAELLSGAMDRGNHVALATTLQVRQLLFTWEDQN